MPPRRTTKRSSASTVSLPSRASAATPKRSTKSTSASQTKAADSARALPPRPRSSRCTVAREGSNSRRPQLSTTSTPGGCPSDSDAAAALVALGASGEPTVAPSPEPSSRPATRGKSHGAGFYRSLAGTPPRHDKAAAAAPAALSGAEQDQQERARALASRALQSAVQEAKDFADKLSGGNGSRAPKADADSEDSEDEDEGALDQNMESWKFTVEEKVAIFEVIKEKLGQGIHAMEFWWKNQAGMNNWYTRVAFHVKKKLAKNALYMATHGDSDRFGPRQMMHLKKWFDSQKIAEKKRLENSKATGSSGGKEVKRLTRTSQLRKDVFDCNAAVNEKRFMREVCTYSGGEDLRLGEDDRSSAGGDAAARSLKITHSATAAGKRPRKPTAGGSTAGAGGSAIGKRTEKPSKGGSTGRGTGSVGGGGGGGGRAGVTAGGGKQKGKGKGKVRKEDVIELSESDEDHDNWRDSSEPEQEEDEGSDAGTGSCGGEISAPEGGLDDDGEGSEYGESESDSNTTRKKRKRVSGGFKPQDWIEQQRQLNREKEKKREKSWVKLAKIMAPRGNKTGGESGSAPVPSVADKLLERKVALAEGDGLKSAWDAAIAAEAAGYGSMQKVREAYDRYQAHMDKIAKSS